MAKNSQRNPKDLSERPGLGTIGLIALFSLLVLWVNNSLLGPDLPLTHDSQNHLARIAQYYVSVREGNIPPVWAGAMNNGFGYPVFLFNYPLANMLALPLIVANIGVQQSFTLITLLGVMISGLGMYFLLRTWFGSQASSIGAVFYMINPYQMSLIYVRGVIGETLSFALLPWVLLMIYRCLRDKQFNWINHVLLILVGTLFLLTHNVIVMLSIPLIIGFVVWTSCGDFRLIKRIIIPGIASVLLAGFFWIPALVEKQFTNLDQVSLSSLYYQHFPTFDQLVFSAWGQGYSYVGPVDGMSFGIGVVTLLLIAWAGLHWLSSKGRPLSVALLIGTIACIVLMMLSLTQPLWSATPLVRYIQFPWRLLFFVQFVTVILIAWLAQINQKKWLLWSVILLIVIFGAKNQAVSDRWFDESDLYWFSFPQTTSVLDENMPRDFDKFRAYELDQELFIDKPVYAESREKVEVIIDYWTGTKRRYRVNSLAEIKIVEKVAYFPGWQIMIDGEQVNAVADTDSYAGMLTYILPAGEHHVVSYIGQQTTARRFGLLLSLVGMILVIVWSKHGGRVYEA